MRKLIIALVFSLIGITASAQFRGLWFEASEYYQLGDSTVTVWGDDTLTNPVMVRSIINWYFTNVKIDSAKFADTASFTALVDTAMYAFFADSANFSDSSYYSDTSGYSFYSDTSNFAYQSAQAVNADSAIYADSAVYSLSMFNLIKVSPTAGGDFTTIADAMNSITDASPTNRYVIDVGPGVYVEPNPITVKAYVGIQGHSLASSVVTPLTPTDDLFLMEDFSEIADLSLAGVTGADKALVRLSEPGGVLLRNMILANASNAVIQENSASDATLLDIGLLADSYPMTNGYVQRAGEMTVNFTQIVGESDIDTVLNLRGKNSRHTCSNIISYSANVGVGMYAADTSEVTGYGLILHELNKGIVVEGDSVFLNVEVVRIFRAQDNGVEATANGVGSVLNINDLTTFDCGGFNVVNYNPTATFVGSGFSQIDNEFFVQGTRLYAYILDVKEGDEGLNVVGELHVGNAAVPSESALGGGDSYNNQMLVYQFDGVSYTNVTDSALVVDGECVKFPNTSVNTAIYISSTVFDTLRHQGIKVNMEVALVPGAGEIVAEYYDGTFWQEFNGMVTNGNAPYAPHAKAYFEQEGSTQLRYDIDMTNALWGFNDPPATGTAHRWVRFRIASTITTTCEIDQIKLHTNRTEINEDGFLEMFGDARNSQILELSIGSGNPIEGNMQNQDIYVDENVGVGFQQNRFTATGDILGYAVNLPDNIDTSCPVNLVWSGRYVTGGAAQWTIRYRRVEPGQTLYTAEPAASGETVTIVLDETVTAAINEIFSVELDLSEYLPTRQGGFGDQVWITFQPTVLPGSFDITNIGAAYYSWAEGGHY